MRESDNETGENTVGPAPTFKKRNSTVGSKKFRRRQRDTEGTPDLESEAPTDKWGIVKKEEVQGGSAMNSALGHAGSMRDNEDEREDDESRMDLLMDLREEQKARRRGGGRSVTALMGTGRKKDKNPLTIMGLGVDGTGPGDTQAVDSFGLKPEPKEPNISTMMESAFKSGGTGGWGAAADSAGAVPHEDLMEEYVKEKMGRDPPRQDKGDAVEENGGNDMLTEEDRLYTIPEDFKRKVEEAKVEFDTGAKKGGEMEGEVGSGAQIAWNTGLAEIALPIEFKIKNMEETMAARDKLEQSRAAKRNMPGESSSLTGSLTANYSHHQREWANQIRALQTRQAMAEESQIKAGAKSGPGMAASALLSGTSSASAGTGGAQGVREGTDGGGRITGPGGVKLKHSSDNAVLERFKKRTRRF